MKPSGSLLTAIVILAASSGPLHAQNADSLQPIEISKLPFIEIFSPTFFWNDEADFVRVGATTCPKGRAIAGGVKIDRGGASLRILESYPDGESWVMKVVNRQPPVNVQSLQVRGFALCMLPAARRVSLQISQYSRIQHQSARFALPTGFASVSGRQACPGSGLVISGGFGLDPIHRGPALPRLELSYPDPNGWNIRAVNGAAATAPAADARVHAVCLGTDEGANIRDFRTVFFVEKDVPVKHSNGVARQSVGCGADQAYAISGGMRTMRGRGASIEMQESFPDTPTSWTIAATNRGDKRAGDATVRLYAVCIKR